MSNIKNEAIDNNISSKKSEISNNNNDNSQITHKSKEIKNVKKVYRYNYSNNNNHKNNINERKNTKIIKIQENNIRYINPKNISISPNRRSMQSPSKLNCETNYSVNKINNTYYVNGLNKNIAKNNSKRSPDLKFIPYENKEIYERKRNINNMNNKRCFIKNKGMNKNININLNNNFDYQKSMKYLSEEELNNQNTNICTCRRDHYLNVKTTDRNNHSFRTISDCSKSKGKNNNLNNTSKTRKYKCDIKICNINNNSLEEETRPFSYDNKIKKRKIINTKMYIKNNNKMFTDSEYEFYRNKSFDNKYLKMQNSQNLQILQEEKMYQILIPILPNEKDHTCHFQIPASNYIKKNNLEEIISESEKCTRTIKTKEYFKKNIKYVTKKCWDKKNSPIRTKIKSQNIEEKNRKFQEELKIEKSNLNYERSPRKWNVDLYQNKDNQFSIEKEHKNKILEETNNEQLSHKRKNWNEVIDKEKLEGINLKGEKPPQKPFEQKEESSFIGKKEDWNNIISVKVENNLMIESDKKNEKNENQNDENEEEVENILNRKVKYFTTTIKNSENNSESSSEYDAMKKLGPLDNRKYENLIKNRYEKFGDNRKVIINNLSKQYQNINVTRRINIQESTQNNINFYKTDILKVDNSDNLIINPQFTNEESRRAAEIKYRQSITNKEIFKKVDSKNILNQSNQSENIEIENEQDNIPRDTNSINEIKSNLDEIQTQSQTIPSPISQLRCEYREEIITKKNLNNEEYNYMEQEYQTYQSNLENSENQEMKAVEEMDENSQKERDSYNGNSINDQENKKTKTNIIQKKKTEFIYKKNKNDKVNNPIKTFIKQTVISNENIIYKNDKSSNNSIQNNYNYNVFYPKEEKIKNYNNNDFHNNNQSNNEYNNNIQLNITKINNINEQNSKGLSKSQLLKKGNDININSQIGKNKIISIGNIILNNTIKSPRKKEIKKIKENEIKKENDDENNLIHHYQSKTVNVNMGNNNQYIQNNKIRILKK